MTEPATHDDDDLDFLDTPMTLKDWQEVISDDLDQAVADLSEDDIQCLIDFLRSKLDSIEVPF